jgi:multidrug efflux pump subunit AcrA (membrane-fusion protein)
MKNVIRFPLFIAVSIGIALAGAVGWYIGAHSSRSDNIVSGRTVLYWQDPMVPGSRFDKPGKSPFMDMELVPVYADEAPAGGQGSAPVVSVQPEIMNNFGVRTAAVTRGKPSREFAAQGYVVRSVGAQLVLADIFERDTSGLRPGLDAVVRLPNLPGRTWAAVVDAIERDIDSGSRSMRARVRIVRTDAQLPDNAFAEVVIRAAPGTGNSLFIPRDALIRTGTRNSVVLALGAGRFQPVDVVPGSESGDYVEILKGLKAGDNVVTSGQFLLDSDANARASFARMQPSAEPENKP